MIAIPWYIALFVGVPEAYFMIILGFKLFNLKINYTYPLIVAVASATVAYFIRQLSLEFGIHTFLCLILMVILCRLLTKEKLWFIFVSILTGFVIVGSLESIIMLLGFSITSMNYSAIALNPWLHLVFFLPELLILLIIYYFVNKYDFYIYSLESKEYENF